MSEETKRRMERLASALDIIPEDEREKIVFGIEMIAAYENKKKTA